MIASKVQVRWAGRFAQLLFPLLLAGILIRLSDDRGPFWLGANSDGSYQYLFNSLLVMNDLPPCHVIHPGTTVQTLGSLLLTATTPGNGVEAMTYNVLLAPERSLMLLQVFFTAFAVIALATTGVFEFERTGSVLCGWAVSGVALLQIETYRSLLFVHPEALLVPLTLLLVVLLIAREQVPPGPSGKRRQRLIDVSLGLIAAAGVVTKVTFAPLCLLPLLVQSGWRGVILTGGSMIVGTAGFLIPLRTQLPRVFEWFTRIANHTGVYGEGESGFLDPKNYFSDLWRMAAAHPVLCAVIGVSALAGGAVTLSRPGDPRARRCSRLLLLTCAVQALGLMIVAKHPAPRYALPLAVSAAFNVSLLLELMRSSAIGRPRTIVRTIAALAALTAVAAIGHELRTSSRDLRSDRDDEIEMKRRVDERAPQSKRIEYYRSSSPEFALFIGNGHAWRFFAPLLSELHPNRVFFDVIRGRFESFAGAIATEGVFSDGPRVLFGDGNLEKLAPGVSFPLPPGWTMRKVDQGRISIIHQLEHVSTGSVRQ